MKVDYDKQTDILSVLFSGSPVEESDEVKPGVSWTMMPKEILDAPWGSAIKPLHPNARLTMLMKE